MRLLITGGSSVLGEKLVADLIDTKRFSIRLLEHQSPLQSRQCEIVRGDITDIDGLMSACSGIDVVCHLAALTQSHDRKAYTEINVGGTEKLIKACEANSVGKVVFVSSAAASEMGGAYAESKLIGEKLIRNSALKWVVVRPSEIYGPEMKEGINKAITWVNKYRIIPIVGDGSYILSPVYLNDVCEAIVQILMRDEIENQSLELCGPEQLKFDELIDRLCLYSRVRRGKIHIPVWVVQLGIAILKSIKSDYFVADQIPRLLSNRQKSVNYTQAIIPYNPRVLEEGLRSLQTYEM